MAKEIGVALVGSGIFAKSQHLPAILATPSLSLKAVYSRSLDSASSLAADLHPKPEIYTDETESQRRGYSDLLSNQNIKCIVIALPILAQPQFIKSALAAGKHVLSEKPVAATSQVATEFYEWWKTEQTRGGAKGTWSVAENFRWLESLEFARTKIATLGRLLSFSVKVHSLVKAGGKYYETAWRKSPGYQGGFLLDGGIHYIAAMRHLLGPDNVVRRVAAFTKQLQPHLPPVDTVNAVLQIESPGGASGTFSVSFGTTSKGSEYHVACERGTVTVLRSKVILETEDSVSTTKEFPDEGSGVRQEMLAWARGVESGTIDSKLSPTEAISDLVLLEAMLRSGERNGTTVDIH